MSSSSYSGADEWYLSISWSFTFNEQCILNEQSKTEDGDKKLHKLFTLSNIYQHLHFPLGLYSSVVEYIKIKLSLIINKVAG